MAEFINDMSVRVNLFTNNDIILDKVDKVLKAYDIDNVNLCPLHYERMARSVAGIVLSFKDTYSMTIVDIEKKYGFSSFVKRFGCNGIPLCDMGGVCTGINESSDLLLATEDLIGITTENGQQIIIEI